MFYLSLIIRYAVQEPIHKIGEMTRGITLQDSPIDAMKFKK